MESAAEFVAALSQEYSAKTRDELLALENITQLSSSNIPSGFEVLVTSWAMLNGTCAVTVEAGKSYLFGYRWRNVVSGFEVTPDGEVTHYPQRFFTESTKERERRKSWGS